MRSRAQEVLACAILACGTFLVHPAVARELPDTIEVYRVAVAEFSGESLSRENGYLLSSLPLQLYEVLDDVSVHLLDDPQIAARQAMIVEELVRSKRGELAALYKSFDRLYLTEGPAGTQRDGTARRISVVIDELSRIEAIEATAVSVAREQPIEFIEEESRRILRAVRTVPQKIARDRNLDALVYGQIEEISGYLFVDIFVYQTGLDSTTMFSTGGSLEVIRSKIDELSEPIIEMLTGRPWGTLVIRSADPSSRIRLDGTYVGGGGSRTLSPLPVGSYSLGVETEGFEAAQYNVSVVAGETTEIDALPGPPVSRKIIVDSTPPGAAIYVGSVLRGTTPLEIAPPLEPVQLRIELDRYGHHQTLIFPAGTNAVSIPLISARIDESAIVRSRRSAFYRSLGSFAASIPVPMMMLDLTNQYTGVANREYEIGSGLVTGLMETRRIALSGYIAGMFVSGALFVNLVIDLLDYVDLVGLRTGSGS